MKFKAPGSDKLVNVNVSEYITDWDLTVSKPQKRVKDFLRPYWRGHVVLEEFRVPKRLWRIDLMSLTTRVAIEVSPRATHSFSPFFHRNKYRFGAAMGREMDKTAWLEANGFTVCEVFDEDIPILSREWFREKYDVIL